MLEQSQLELFKTADPELLELADNPLDDIAQIEEREEKIKELEELKKQQESAKEELASKFTLLTRLMEREEKIKRDAAQHYEKAAQEMRAENKLLKSAFADEKRTIYSDIERIAEDSTDDVTTGKLLDLLAAIEPTADEKEGEEPPTLDAVAS